MRASVTSGSLFNGLAIIGTGAAVSFPEQRWIGGIIILIGVSALIFDIRVERGHVAIGSPQTLGKRLKRVWPQYLMLVCAIGFFIGLIAFLQINVTPPQNQKVASAIEPNLDPNARGFFAVSVVRLYDTPQLRRKYIFDFLAPTGARISFYVSPSDVFVFSVTDINKEPFSLEVPIASDDIPLTRYIFLYCEVALQESSTQLRIIVDGKQVNSRTFGVRVELGKDYWKWTRSTFGADTDGQNNAPFKVAMHGSGHVPMTDQQVLLMRYSFKAALPGISLP